MENKLSTAVIKVAKALDKQSVDTLMSGHIEIRMIWVNSFMLDLLFHLIELMQNR